MDLSMLPDFIVEAVEHLEEMEDGLLQLEQDKENRDILNEIFRSIHSIKGAAQYIGLERVSELSHKLESLLDLIRQGKKQLNQNNIDLFIAVRDRINVLVGELDRTQSEKTEIDDLLHRIKEAMAEPGQEKNILETAGDNKVGGRVPVKTPARLKDETLDEEYDEELLDIFMNQLKENIAFLQTQITALESSVDKQAVLDRCRDTLVSLHSSANYMSYTMLCEHYNAWQAEIDAAQHKLSADEVPGFDFMRMYLDEIIRTYPRVAADLEQEQEEESMQEQKEDCIADASRDGLEQALDSLFADSEEESTVHARDNGVSAEKKLPEDVPELAAALSDAFDETTDSEIEESTVHARDNGVSAEKKLPEDVPELAAALSDAFDETTDSVSPVKTPMLENETLDEEYDEELLNIFMNQLKENITFLQTQITALESSVDKQAVLNRCRDTITCLHSSANYMSYNMLCEYYNAWQADIDAAQHKLSVDEVTGFDFMQMYLDEIIRIYPRAAVEPVQREKPVQEKKDDCIAAANREDLVQALDSIFDTPAAANEEDLGLQEKEKQTDGQSETVTPISETTRTEHELFGKLKDALEVSLEEQENVHGKKMHAVIEEMISPASQDVVTVQPAAKEDAPGKGTPSMIAEEGNRQDRPALNDGAEDEIPAQQAEQQKPGQHLTKQDLTKRPEKDSGGTKKVQRSMRVDADKIDYLLNQVGELVVSRAYFSQLFNEIKTLQQGLLEKTDLTKHELKPLNEFSFRLGEAGVALGRVSNELQEAVMKVRMLPISQLFKRYPRLVRDLVHKSDKQVRLEVRGEETELDKMVIEEMSDPLIHIIRNAVDHGIETVSRRKHLGKPETGTLILEAYHESNHIVIEITDDGKGIDPERIKMKALEKELYSEEELDRMTPLELTRLIMVPGFSTTEKATGTSGRGVGMDVVRKNIEKLNGTLDIESQVGRQTRMRIKIPLTLAIIQALMVRVGREIFTIPLTTVEETLRIFQNEISEIEGVEVIHLRNATMPIFRLSKLFNMQEKSVSGKKDKFFMVVVGTGMQNVGLVVDELLGQEEVVIKPMADYLQAESGFSGATIIGDGAISLILDVPELIKMNTEEQISKQKNLAFRRRRMTDTEMTGQQTQTVH